MVSMGITQARTLVGEIRKAAEDFIACAVESHDDPGAVAAYIDGIDDRITRYVRAMCEVGAAMLEIPDDKIGLNLGCGTLSYGPEVFNVDLRQTEIVDALIDLEDYPWPLPNERFEFVYMTDIYEHLREAWLPLEECWRVLKPDGRVFIRTGCWETKQSFTDPSHVRFPTENTFDFTDRRTMFGKKYPHFTSARFEVLTAERSGEELVFTLVKEVLDDGGWDMKIRYPKRRY